MFPHFVLLAKFSNLINREWALMSFMNITKARGPTTEPCGTPEVTGAQSEVSPLSTVLWVLLASQVNTLPWISPAIGGVGPCRMPWRNQGRRSPWCSIDPARPWGSPGTAAGWWCRTSYAWSHVDLYASLSLIIFCYPNPAQRFLKWIRIRPNDTDPTGSGFETLHNTHIDLEYFFLVIKKHIFIFPFLDVGIKI